jgi:hypothetical protein
LKNNIEIIQGNRITELGTVLKPTGKRNIARARKKWKDQFLDETSWNRLHMPRILLQEKQKGVGGVFLPAEKHITVTKGSILMFRKS